MQDKQPNTPELDLAVLGWDTFFQRAFAAFDAEKLQPARVMAQHKGFFEVRTAYTNFLAGISGRLRHAARGPADLPAVGDWVVVNRSKNLSDRAHIAAVLPRKTKFSRKAPASDMDEQVIAANIDTVFIVQGLDLNFNVRRIERYLAMIYDSGALPVVILNKADLCAAAGEKRAEVRSVAFGVPVHIISSVNRSGYDELSPYLKQGHTIGFLGSSGVGKSTIINNLLGENVQKTSEVRAYDSKGRHTTTHREIFVMKAGGMLLDTPGMRELQLWEADSGVKDTFQDIDALAGKCRFRNCRHDSEPGCAVVQAVEEGAISAERRESFVKLKRELACLESKKEQEHWQKRNSGGKKLPKDMKRVIVAKPPQP
jgi:ribosome biogenesis GTPase